MVLTTNNGDFVVTTIDNVSCILPRMHPGEKNIVILKNGLIVDGDSVPLKVDDESAMLVAKRLCGGKMSAADRDKLEQVQEYMKSSKA